MQHLATTKLQFASTPNELHVILCWHLNLKLYFPINFLVHPILHDKAACQTTKRLKIRWVFFDIVCASRSKHNFQNNRGKPLSRAKSDMKKYCCWIHPRLRPKRARMNIFVCWFRCCLSETTKWKIQHKSIHRCVRRFPFSLFLSLFRCP